MLSLHISGGKDLHLHGHQVVKVRFSVLTCTVSLSCNPHLGMFYPVLGLTNRTGVSIVKNNSNRLNEFCLCMIMIWLDCN